MTDALEILKRMRSCIVAYPRLAVFLADVEADARSYVRTISVHNAALQEGNRDDIVTADQSRHLAHNRLIDSLNILSRQFAAEGVDNSWRGDIGMDRQSVMRWAVAVVSSFDT